MFGREYWQRIINFEAMAAEGVINTEDLSLIDYAETAEEGWRIIREFHRRTCEDSAALGFVANARNSWLDSDRCLNQIHQIGDVGAYEAEYRAPAVYGCCRW